MFILYPLNRFYEVLRINYLIYIQSLFLNFTSWLPDATSKQTYITRDIIAGTTIAMIIIPQSMAYATLANLDPVYGLYASFIPVAIAAFFGSSRYLTTGPEAMVSLLTAVAITSLSLGDESLYVPLAIMLALSVGVFQITLSKLVMPFFHHYKNKMLKHQYWQLLITQQLNNGSLINF